MEKTPQKTSCGSCKSLETHKINQNTQEVKMNAISSGLDKTRCTFSANFAFNTSNVKWRTLIGAIFPWSPWLKAQRTGAARARLRWIARIHSHSCIHTVTNQFVRSARYWPRDREAEGSNPGVSCNLLPLLLSLGVVGAGGKNPSCPGLANGCRNATNVIHQLRSWAARTCRS